MKLDILVLRHSYFLTHHCTSTVTMYIGPPLINVFFRTHSLEIFNSITPTAWHLKPQTLMTHSELLFCYPWPCLSSTRLVRNSNIQWRELFKTTLAAFMNNVMSSSNQLQILGIKLDSWRWKKPFDCIDDNEMLVVIAAAPMPRCECSLCLCQQSFMC